jgi:transposase
MADIDSIREEYFTKGKSIARIAAETGRDRKTVHKYISHENWNEGVKGIAKKATKLDAFKTIIDQWLDDDRRMRRKQRHTARRVYDRLVEEYRDDGFDCSYRTVAAYVAEAKHRLYGDHRCYLPLEHQPGEAQVDFGRAEFIERGRRIDGSYVNLSFPHSNAGYCQLFKGENFECLAEGLKNIYTYIGGVPSRQWFDNASTMVVRVLKNGGRQLTDSFLRFKAHHGFEAVFCNPAQGNEKGHVESKVGYHRRNFLVPMPVFDDIEAYNARLLERCRKDMQRGHYRKERLIVSLFEEDLKASRPLPHVAFDVCSYKTVRTDSYGKFSLENGRHLYSSMPKMASHTVTVCLRAHTVTVLDENLREMVRHDRLYGPGKQESMDWIPYLRQLARYPSALKYSGIYRMLPDAVRQWMDRCGRQEKGKALKLLAELTEYTDFVTASESFRQSLTYEAFDVESVLALHTRLVSRFPDLETIRLSESVPVVPSLHPDTGKYDRMIQGSMN